MFAFVLWALVANLLGAVSTHGLKIQKVANRQAIINKFPGCAILGTPSWPSNSVMKNVGASSAGQCRDKCMNWWKASKRRGIELWNNDGWDAAFRHEGCYLQVAQFADPGESCTARRTGDYNSFIHDNTESWKAWPCYKGTVHQGDASSNYLPVKARFEYKYYIQSQYLHEKNGNSPDKLNVQVKSSPYICSWSRANQGWAANGNHYPCIAYEYNSKDNVCTVHQKRPGTSGSFTNVNPSQGNTRVTGNMYCDKDFNKENVARDVANLYQAPGCMKHHYNWPGADLKSDTGFSDPHECRRWCQEESDCVVWVYARNRNRCWLKTADAYKNEYESPNEDIYAGMKDCHTCFPGYYISDTDPSNGIDSCYICPKGYYCYEGEKTACESGEFCGVEGLSTPLDPSSENRCDADYSGSGCEHHVCRDSALGEKLSALAFEEPTDFDFSAYAIPTNAEQAGGWELVLSVPPTSSAAQDSVHVKSSFTEMIRTSIVEEYRLVVTSSVGDSTATSWTNYLADCGLAGDNAPRLALDPNLRVGDEFTACLELTWRELNKPLTWADLSETQPDEPKESARSCVTQTISLVARGNVLVNDINAASGCREVLMLLMMLLVGVQVGRMLEFDYRAITARHQETLPAMAKLPGYKLRIHPDEVSRMPRSTRTSAEALAQSVLAWWSPELDEVRANVVARLSSLEYELEMCSDNRWCDVSAGNDRTCRVCRYGTDECYVGTVAVTMAPEENVPMNEDRGTWSHFKAFKEAFKSDLIYERYPLRTVHLRCIFASPIKRVLPFEHYELRHDYGFDGRSPQTLRVGHVPDRGADMIKDKPVVCGRVLFDQVYGKSIAYFVENNVQHGIATTIMYEVGTSRIKDRAVLETYKREGSLVIVDLRDVFQDHYGIWSRWIVWNTKAFLQSFTRKDCLDRVSPLQPSWVGFLDLDEYLTANIFQSVRPDINIMQLFMLAPVDDEGREDTRFCNAPPEEKIVVGGKAKTGLTKLFVRPNVPYTSIKVHWIDILTHVYNERDLPHVRVIQPSEAFLYHVRCANLGMS
ncbi:Hypothetical Protein FCC1311_015682 [Hondaea fermentalgiana]|uniref:Apple domain-containing protein n=1 Tax=Hondaea fermentalgiana TaxID=2315210 RepID=A0A2R5G2W7_9STRA|nr:Hypothetical Protein FCC1311_015682 [Hondaea fermentalgiana]|eukprot:GBG25350.1 Hypothetical Protein FCC1311_015682 [Hondaea fermentalgiana]